MGKPGSNSGSASATASKAPTLATLAQAASDQASKVEPRKRTGEVVLGPLPVGGLGEVAVVEREQGSAKYLWAEFTPAGGGKAKSIPLAAVAALTEHEKELG